MNEKFLAALIASGLTQEQANIYANLITIQDETKIDEIVTKIKGTIPQTPEQSEVDKRVTQGVKTAIANYEKKYKLKEGEKISTIPPATIPPITPTTPETKTDDPRFAQLTEMMQKLTESVTGIVTKNQADERSIKISKALTDAKIPDSMHKRFSIKDDVNDEDLTTAITEYKQELTDLGISSLQVPGGGTSKGALERAAENAAKTRNEGGTVKGGTPAKKL